ncbi:hypothetical protein [Sediminimonas qiaohouensis]|uniref:hypothetical protein n=1 Tax=Sediminimonas qiaohouensis TaxID=552061 RepID=UPI0003FBD5EE|nr:hypothetical protein [Sediminimonas qiaohouensis]
MAMTPAERKKAQREREREASLVAPESTKPYLKRLFSEAWEESAQSSDFALPLELAGIEPPTFEDERNPEEVSRDNEATGIGSEGYEDVFVGYDGAIGRAEVTIGSLLDAAQELAGIVNRYKREEIKARLAELENSETIDRATMINEAVKLNKILDLLDKRDRRDLPRWRVTGV